MSHLVASSVQGYRDLDEAITFRNDSEYDLSAGVSTKDLTLAPEVTGPHPEWDGPDQHRGRERLQPDGRPRAQWHRS
jgi:hypothetical protein